MLRKNILLNSDILLSGIGRNLLSLNSKEWEGTRLSLKSCLTSFVFLSLFRAENIDFHLYWPWYIYACRIVYFVAMNLPLCTLKTHLYLWNQNVECQCINDEHLSNDKKKSNCFTMTIFLMFKIKLVRLKCPLAYAWVKNNVPSNFQLSFLDIDE